MSLLGNILWLVFGGFFAAIGYLIGGLTLCLTIIGIPFGWQSIQLGFASFMPFGKTLKRKEGGSGMLALIFNLIWIVLFGWILALNHLIFGLLFAITIIGLPFAQQHFKLMIMAFQPFSYTLED